MDADEILDILEELMLTTMEFQDVILEIAEDVEGTARIPAFRRIGRGYRLRGAYGREEEMLRFARRFGEEFRPARQQLEEFFARRYRERGRERQYRAGEQRRTAGARARQKED